MDIYDYFVIKQKKESTKLVKRNSRKKNCEACQVGTGSRHNPHCKYAFTGFPNQKTKNKKLGIVEKLKAIKAVLKS